MRADEKAMCASADSAFLHLYCIETNMLIARILSANSAEAKAKTFFRFRCLLADRPQFTRTGCINGFVKGNDPPRRIVPPKGAENAGL
jgi:hypothetical protein